MTDFSTARNSAGKGMAIGVVISAVIAFFVQFATGNGDVWT
jgi:hypothetical protein